MRKPDVYWHIYRNDHIKPQWRGRLTYVLEIPRTVGTPVLRHAFDPAGEDFPQGEEQIINLLQRLQHGIVFCGVNKAAIEQVIRSDPPLSAQEDDFLRYNHALVRNSQALFLQRSSLSSDKLPEKTARLLAGRAV